MTDSLEVAALADTLDRMAAELDDKLQSLVHRRNEREAILSSMAEGVLAIDAGERILRLNMAAARLLEVDPARAEGRTLLEVVRNVDLSSLVAAVLETHEPLEGEVVLRGRGERYLYVHGTVLQACSPSPTRAGRAPRHHRTKEAGNRAPRFRGQCVARTADARHLDQGLRGNPAGWGHARSGRLAAIPANRRLANRPPQRHHRGPADAGPRRARRRTSRDRGHARAGPPGAGRRR